MTEYILLAAMAAVIVLLLFLRTNTAIGYLALAAGSVLLLSSGENVGLVAQSLTSGMSNAAMVSKILLLLAPLAVCVVLLRGQMTGMLLVFGLLPAMCTAFLGTVLVIPLLSEGLQGAIEATATWSALVQYQEAYTGIGLVVSILIISLSVKRPDNKKGKKHH